MLSLMKKTFLINQYKNNKVAYENIRKIDAGQGDDYTTGCLLDYIYFKNFYKMIVVDADPKANQQINFIANSDRAGNARIYFILEEVKETHNEVLDFSQRTVKFL